MEYRKLGGSDLKVSLLCLGTMNYGGAEEEEETCHAILTRAVETGINFIDTADVYGRDGLSERILGNWFEKTGLRDGVVLATKFRFGMAEGASGTAASRPRIMRACEASLKRLKTDFIELYQIHMQDIETPEDETLRALDDLVRQGKVRHIGCCNYTAYRMVDSLWLSATKNLAGWVSLQAQYSLIERGIEREHIPACLEHGVGIIPWSPLAGGFLSGKYRRGEEPPSGTRFEKETDRYRRLDKERNWAILGAAGKLAKDIGASTTQVSLAWLLRKPAVSSVIFGARTLKQLEENLGAAALSLSDAHMANLDEVSVLDMGYPYDMIERVHGCW